jgi:CO dehydrogenase maturation factor
MMIVVSDANRQSLAVAGTIARMAQGAGIPRVMLLGNRIRNEQEHGMILSFAEKHAIPMLGVIPYDPAVSGAGISGEPVLSLDGTLAFLAIEEITWTVVQVVSGNTCTRGGMT